MRVHFSGISGSLAGTRIVGKPKVFLGFCIQSARKPYKTCAFCNILLKIMKKLGFVNIELRKDLQGKDRMVRARKVSSLYENTGS